MREPIRKFSKNFGPLTIHINIYINHIVDISIVTDGQGFQNITTFSTGIGRLQNLNHIGQWLIEINKEIHNFLKKKNA